MSRQIAEKAYRPERDLLVLDGIPRNVAQSKALDSLIEVLRVVHLRPPDIELMVQRLKGRALKENRQDDADERVIRRRFEIYDAETAPVLDYYDPKLMSDVNAAGTPVEVLLHVLEEIVPVYRERFGNPLG